MNLLVYSGICVAPFFLIRSRIGIEVVLSFFLLVPIFLLLARISLGRRGTGLSFCAVTVFFILFFFIAPIWQLSANPDQLINTMPVVTESIVLANAYTLAFLGVFVLVYIFAAELNPPKLLTVENDQAQNALPYIAFAAVVVGAWAFTELNVQDVTKFERDQDVNYPFGLIKYKVLFMIPFLAISLYLLARKKRRLQFIVLLGAVLATKNPLFESRNALGPVYLCILVWLVPYFLERASRFFYLLLFTLGVGFPLASIFTHHEQAEWKGLLTGQQLLRMISDHFVDMHYDAWSNLIAAIELMHTRQLYMGKQLLGSLLFFVPRSGWPDKPKASGYLIGDYLTLNHSMWFDNLSTPLVAEGYIDFGFLGIILFAVLLAYYSKYVDALCRSGKHIDKILGVYLCYFTFFILRGALLPALAYGAGAFFTIRIFPYLISRLSQAARSVLFLRAVASENSPPRADAPKADGLHRN